MALQPCRDILWTILNIDRFYNGKSIDAVDPEYVRVSAIAEFFLHAVHNLTIHRRYMQEYPWYVWERSLSDIYNKSPILQQFLHEHSDWYTVDVHRILTGKSPTLGATAFVSSARASCFAQYRNNGFAAHRR